MRPMRRHNLKRHPIECSHSSALRARVGRAAKRHRMTYVDWVACYGMVDTMPTALSDEGRDVGQPDFF